MAARRSILLVAAALAATLLLWLAALSVTGARIEVREAEGGGVAVRAELGGAVCAKALTRDFPWVRIDCGAVPNVPPAP